MKLAGASIGSAGMKSPPHGEVSQFRLAPARLPSLSTTYDLCVFYEQI
jgi:hypothetical protein